jgi:hypothetical protein
MTAGDLAVESEEVITLGEIESESEDSGELYLDVPRESAMTAGDLAVESEEVMEEIEELEPGKEAVLEIIQDQVEKSGPRRKIVAFLLVVIMLLLGALGFFAYKYFELKEQNAEVEYLRAEVEKHKMLMKKCENEKVELQADAEVNHSMFMKRCENEKLKLKAEIEALKSNHERLENEKLKLKAEIKSQETEWNLKRDDWKVKQAKLDSEFSSISADHASLRSFLLESFKQAEMVDLTNPSSFESSIQNKVVMVAIETGRLQALQMLREAFGKKICDLQKLLFIQAALKRGNIDATKILLGFETTKDMFHVLKSSGSQKYNQRMYNMLWDVIITIVTIGDADVFREVLHLYGNYIVVSETLDTSAVKSENIYSIGRSRASLFGIATIQALHDKKSDVLKVVKRYGNVYAIPSFVDRIAEIRRLSGTELSDFLKKKADQFRREGTYIELKELITIDWKVMIDCYMENFLQPQDHDFYLKEAREDRQHVMVQLLLEQKDKLQSQ